MPRLTIPTPFASLHSSVLLALLAAGTAMAATVGVSILASEEVAAASDVYGRRLLHQPAAKGGKRAVRAAATPIPAPDATLVVFVPAMTCLANETAEVVYPMFDATVRPLHETGEVPENFI